MTDRRGTIPDKRFITLGNSRVGTSHNLDHIELIIWDHDKKEAEVLPSGWLHTGNEYEQLRSAIMGTPDPEKEQQHEQL